jgi:hypothetical protein
MENTFVIAAIISITFLLAKFLEMRYIEKESKPLKFLMRDAFLVYFSVIIAIFIIDQINPLIKGGTTTKVTQVFTDNPGF